MENKCPFCEEKFNKKLHLIYHTKHKHGETLSKQRETPSMHKGEIRHKAERLFLASCCRDKTYLYEAVRFRLPDNSTYTPDFYCVEDNLFIEVIGTRQAFHKNKKKYAFMHEAYPEVKLVFIKIDEKQRHLENLTSYIHRVLE